VTGGPGRPEELERGYYVRPTVFANVTPAMTIAREEIFGPVLSDANEAATCRAGGPGAGRQCLASRQWRSHR
jgi:hypothetical protein